MNKLTIAASIIAGVLSIQCSERTDRKVEEAQESVAQDIRDERDAIKKDLQSLRDDINDRLDDVSVKVDKASGNAKSQLEEAKQQLIVQRDKVEKRLDEIDKSSDDTWDDIQQGARNTADEVKVEFERVKENIKDKLNE